MSVKLPSAAMATTRAVPSPTAVSVPDASTVTIFSSSVTKVTRRSVAFSGLRVT